MVWVRVREQVVVVPAGLAGAERRARGAWAERRAHVQVVRVRVHEQVVVVVPAGLAGAERRARGGGLSGEPVAKWHGCGYVSKW